MYQEYFSRKVLLGIVTGCNKSINLYRDEGEVLDFMSNVKAEGDQYGIVLARCRAEILRQYPDLLAENSAKDLGGHLMEEEQNRILGQMKERFKEFLVNDCLPISRPAST